MSGNKNLRLPVNVTNPSFESDSDDVIPTSGESEDESSALTPSEASSDISISEHDGLESEEEPRTPKNVLRTHTQVEVVEDEVDAIALEDREDEMGGDSSFSFSVPQTKEFRGVLDSKTVTDISTSPLDVSGKQLGDPIIVVEDVVKNYKLGKKGNFFSSLIGRGQSNSVRALSTVSLSEDSEFAPIREGEFVMVRGKSGCGKTTLLNCIGTIDKVSEGSITLNGTKISGRTWDYKLSAIRLKEIGFVFQTYNLISTLSAVENVALPMNLISSGTKTERLQRAVKLLRMVELGDRLGHLPSELSGGEQQRVTIARSMANNPPILLLDEPTGSLATKQTVEIMDLLLRINLDYKKTLVMVSHNPDLECYADRVLYMKDGKFMSQIVNDKQRKLDVHDYNRYLKAQEEMRRKGHVNMFG